MKEIIEMYIDDARSYQQHGSYDLAILSLEKAKSADIHRIYEVEIEKLLGFNYRKMQKYNEALYHLNNAVNTAKRASDKNGKKEYAICLMNRGVLYEELARFDKALTSYLPAVDIFLSQFSSSPNDFGIIINALLTVGMLYYRLGQNARAKHYFEKTLPFFDADVCKENDRRYVATINTLNDINNLLGNSNSRENDK